MQDIFTVINAVLDKFYSWTSFLLLIMTLGLVLALIAAIFSYVRSGDWHAFRQIPSFAVLALMSVLIYWWVAGYFDVVNQIIGLLVHFVIVFP